MLKTTILLQLIESYERSKHLRDPGTSNRRVMLRVAKKELKGYEFESAQVRDMYNQAAVSLAEQGLITIVWSVQDKLISELILRLDAVEQSYTYLHRPHPKELAESAILQINQELSTVTTLWIQAWQSAICEWIAQHWKLPTIYKNSDFFAGFLHLLTVYDKLQGSSVTLRGLSVQCYQNSKTLEQVYVDSFLSIARQYHPVLSQEEYSSLGQRESLACLGVYARPELYELAGDITLQFSNGDVSFAPLLPVGGAVNSGCVANIEAIVTSNIKQVLFIENKTNYDEYLLVQNSTETLVVYHGGFISPIKGQFYRKLYNSLPPSIPIFLWSDIDLGGFRIFEQLQSIFPRLQPWGMDAKYIQQWAEHGLTHSDAYFATLQTALENQQYPLFSQQIEAILHHHVTIEQEVFLQFSHENFILKTL